MDEHGRSDNPTKSLCDNYVFNTVLTRSKSLVVVAGSPHALLRTESLMRKQTSCWKSYIKSCIRNNTFIVPESVEPDDKKRSQFLSNLKTTIFESTNVNPGPTAHPLNSQSLLVSLFPVMAESGAQYSVPTASITSGILSEVKLCLILKFAVSPHIPEGYTYLHVFGKLKSIH